MDAAKFKQLVAEIPYGKRLPAALYCHTEGANTFPHELEIILDQIHSRLEIKEEFNLVKFHLRIPKISFLSYPTFKTDPHPALHKSVIVDLSTGTSRHLDYRKQANPPILHRKETFLPAGHPLKKKFTRLTQQEEVAGLLSESASIGFRLNWEKRLQEAGYKITGHRLVKSADESFPPVPKSTTKKVIRERTAISRSELSKPVKVLVESGLLRHGHSFFDYGCGLGSDIKGLSALGYIAAGWDPDHAPTKSRIESSIVNLGFVLNVIEDPAERVTAIQGAWRLTTNVLAVSVLIAGDENYVDVESYGDGVLTKRSTFQKYFEPLEIHAFIEDALGVEAFPAAHGVFLVFRHIGEAQSYLERRGRRHIDWTSLSRKLGLLRALKTKRDPYRENPALLDSFWETILVLGRLPRPDEFEQLDEVRKFCGSLPKALQFFIDRFGEATFETARERRREDLLVYLASGYLRKRIRFGDLSPRLQRDIRGLFGSHTRAEALAKDLMFAAGDEGELELAWSEWRGGHFDDKEGHLVVHRSLLDELPAVLRVYVECAARLWGDPKEADIIKLHIWSKKVSFQYYHDFDGEPLPELKARTKIDLLHRSVRYYDHTRGRHHQLLFFKERFLPSDYPGRKQMERFSSRLRKLGLHEDTIGHGPSKEEFHLALEQCGLTKGLARKPSST